MPLTNKPRFMQRLNAVNQHRISLGLPPLSQGRFYGRIKYRAAGFRKRVKKKPELKARLESLASPKKLPFEELIREKQLKTLKQLREKLAEGKKFDEEAFKEHQRARFRSFWKIHGKKPEVKAKRNEYMKEYWQRPEVQKRRRAYKEKYLQRPEVKKRNRAYWKKYRQKPEVQKRRRAYWQKYSQRPEVKKRIRDYMQKYFQRPEVIRRLEERNAVRFSTFRIELEEKMARENPETQTIQKLSEEQINQIVQQSLAPKEFQVIQDLFGLDNAELLAEEEVAEKHGLSTEQVRQIRHDALQKLRIPELKELME